MAVVAVTASEVEVLPASSEGEADRLAALCSALAAENELLWGVLGRVTGGCERLRARAAKLVGLLEEARRAGKRQAAPFSRGEPRRKPGPALGGGARAAWPSRGVRGSGRGAGRAAAGTVWVWRGDL